MPPRMIFITRAFAASMAAWAALTPSQEGGINFNRRFPVHLHRRRVGIIQRLLEPHQAEIDHLKLAAEELVDAGS